MKLIEWSWWMKSCARSKKGIIHKAATQILSKSSNCKLQNCLYWIIDLEGIFPLKWLWAASYKKQYVLSIWWLIKWSTSRFLKRNIINIKEKYHDCSSCWCSSCCCIFSCIRRKTIIEHKSMLLVVGLAVL